MPFWIVGIIVFTVGLIAMYVIYSIFPEGKTNLFLLGLLLSFWLLKQRGGPAY